MTSVTWRLVTYNKGMQEKYQYALAKHHPLAVRQMLSSLLSILIGLNNDKLLIKFKEAHSNDDNLNNLMQDWRRVVHMSSTNRYYLAMPDEWAREVRQER